MTPDERDLAAAWAREVARQRRRRIAHADKELALYLALGALGAGFRSLGADADRTAAGIRHLIDKLHEPDPP